MSDTASACRCRRPGSRAGEHQVDADMLYDRPWREGGRPASADGCRAARWRARNRVRHPGRLPQQPQRTSRSEVQVGDHGEDVGVARALAMAVERALHVRRAGVDGRERLAPRTRVVVAVDAEPGLVARARARRRPPRRAAATVGVAEHRDVGAGLDRDRSTSRAYAGLLAYPSKCSASRKTRRPSARRWDRSRTIASSRPGSCAGPARRTGGALPTTRLPPQVTQGGHQGVVGGLAPGRRVAPNAAMPSRSSSVEAAEDSVSLGLAPGHPPSMNPPRACRGVRPAFCPPPKDRPSCWAPSRSVVS